MGDLLEGFPGFTPTVKAILRELVKNALDVPPIEVMAISIVDDPALDCDAPAHCLSNYREL